jgi:DNA-binding NarL/FixJ family response regulator
MPLSILVADDHPGIRQSVQDYLELEGYSVITAPNGEMALRRLASDRPHLIIADIKMPLMDGYELVKTLRQRPEFRLIPVIFLTECVDTSDRIQGYKVGCDAYLPKPFELDELMAVVRNLLERAQMIQSELRFTQYHAIPDTFSPAQHLSGALDFSTDAIAPEQEVEPLTDREQEVLELLVQGCSNTDMGKTLHLSPRTVEKYVSSLLRKTQTPNRTTLVRFAMDHHLVS